MAFFLILAGSQTAEIEGISAAGSTAVSRRYTAVADAELLLRGPMSSKKMAFASFTCWCLSRID